MNGRFSRSGSLSSAPSPPPPPPPPPPRWAHPCVLASMQHMSFGPRRDRPSQQDVFASVPTAIPAAITFGVSVSTGPFVRLLKEAELVGSFDSFARSPRQRRCHLVGDHRRLAQLVFGLDLALLENDDLIGAPESRARRVGDDKQLERGAAQEAVPWSATACSRSSRGARGAGTWRGRGL